MEKNIEIPRHITIIEGVIVATPVILSFIFSTGFQGILAAIVAVVCGRKNYKWAIEIKKNGNIAFAIGAFFGLFGLLGYYIYYRIKRKN